MLLQQAFDPLQALQMPDSVLRHGTGPPVDAGKKRISCQLEDLSKLFANHPNNLFIRRLQNRFAVSAANKAAEQGTALGSAVRKLVMHKSRGEHAFALAARDEESEARG